METKKKEIVEEFLKLGKLLTPAALDFIANSKNYKKLFEVVREVEDLVVDLEDLTSFETEEEKVKIILNIPRWPKEVSIQDFAKYVRDRYEKMKRIITSRVNLEFRSLANLPEGESYCIGMVRELRESGGKVEVYFEDPTGSRVIIFDENPDLSADDVVAVKCVRRGEVVYGKEVIFPDVPLREPRRGYGKVCILGDLHLDEAPLEPLKKFFDWLRKTEIRFILVTGDIGDYGKFLEFLPDDKTFFLIPGEIDEKIYPRPAPSLNQDSVVPLSDPAMLEINGLKFLLIHDFNIEMLKKRCLGKAEKIYERDYLVLEEVPDIVACGHTHEANYFNFKSITIVNPGSLLTEFRPTVIDLKTREVTQLRF